MKTKEKKIKEKHCNNRQQKPEKMRKKNYKIIDLPIEIRKNATFVIIMNIVEPFKNNKK